MLNNAAGAGAAGPTLSISSGPISYFGPMPIRPDGPPRTRISEAQLQARARPCLRPLLDLPTYCVAPLFPWH